jgi:hypothetical protein
MLVGRGGRRDQRISIDDSVVVIQNPLIGALERGPSDGSTALTGDAVKAEKLDNFVDLAGLAGEIATEHTSMEVGNGDDHHTEHSVQATGSSVANAASLSSYYAGSWLSHWLYHGLDLFLDHRSSASANAPVVLLLTVAPDVAQHISLDQSGGRCAPCASPWEWSRRLRRRSTVWSPT